MSLLTLMGNSG